MVDKGDGEIWHMVSGIDNKPVIAFPKTHNWKTSLHSFEHALFGYLTSSQILDKNFKLYYAFRNVDAVTPETVKPYLFRGNIIHVNPKEEINFTENKHIKIEIEFNSLY